MIPEQPQGGISTYVYKYINITKVKDFLGLL